SRSVANRAPMKSSWPAPAVIALANPAASATFIVSRRMPLLGRDSATDVMSAPGATCPCTGVSYGQAASPATSDTWSPTRLLSVMSGDSAYADGPESCLYVVIVVP